MLGRMSSRAGHATLAALVAALAFACAAPPGAARAQSRPRAALESSSAAAAYGFLDAMMDRYAAGATPRLVQSFTGGKLQKKHFTDSVTYDDALTIDALLARGQPDDVARAAVIGEALLFVQANDPAHDGRVRAAYAPAPLTVPADVRPTDPATDVGNMAWVGQALVQLSARTARHSFLDGAVAIGSWIRSNTYDTRGSGGYTGGLDAKGRPLRWKSTEHNIDAYALFELLAGQTGEASWRSDAAWARGFVESMWEPLEGMFHVGSGEDGVTPNDEVLAEDVNSWSYLALGESAFARSIDWDVGHLAVSRKGFSGVSFCSGDRSGVWFEGTAHLADALLLRAGPGDASSAQAYLADIEHAQSSGLNNDGKGIIAASKNGLKDCEGDRYFASLHTGASAWYLLALRSADPFRLLSGSG